MASGGSPTPGAGPAGSWPSRLAPALAAPVVLALLAVVVTLAWRSRGWPLTHDAPIMHYAAWRIARGAVPYRDLFDMNFPGVYLLHLGVLKALGPGDLAWRAFDLGWLALTGLALGRLVAPAGAVASVAAALLFAAYHLAGGAWQAGQRDFLLGLCLVLGALGIARWIEDRRATPSAVGAGLVLGIGASFKPHAIALAAAFGVVAAVVDRRRRAGAGRVAAYVAACGVAPAAVVVWVAARGGLDAWRSVVLDYLVPLYSRLGRPARWGVYRGEVWLPLGLAAILSLAALVLARRFTARVALVVLGVAYGLLHYVAQGKGWEYHLYPLAVFTAALAVLALRALPGRAAWLGAASALSLLVAAALLAVKGLEASDAGWIHEKSRRVEAIVTTLRPELRPGDTVQVLDTTDGGIHALLRLGVAEPTRFLYDFHFFHDVDRPIVRALRAELVRDLTARPPRFVVLFERGWPAGGYERFDTFPELAIPLAMHYRRARTGDGYLIYAKRGDP